MAITIEVTLRLEVTRTLLASTTDINIVDSDITATSCTTQYVVVFTLLRRCTSNVPDLNVLDDDAVRRVSSWPTIEVILLDIDTVYGNILDADVLEKDVGDETCGIGV
jgi:hypothetical protein